MEDLGVVFQLRMSVSKGLDGFMDAPSYLLFGQLGEPSLDRVQPGGAGGCEVQMEADECQEPGSDGFGLVRGVAVQDQIHIKAVGDIGTSRPWC